MLYVLLQRATAPALSSEVGTPYRNVHASELAGKIVSDLQDFVADAFCVWWPTLGDCRLHGEIECQEDRLRLLFTFPDGPN